MNSDPRITPDDPRLTAFALGELEGAERDAVAAALAADPALERVGAQLRAAAAAVQGQLRAAEGGQLEFSALLEEQIFAKLADESAKDAAEALTSTASSQTPAASPQTSAISTQAAAALPQTSATQTSATQMPAAPTIAAGTVSGDGTASGYGTVSGGGNSALDDAIASRALGVPAAYPEWVQAAAREAQRRVAPVDWRQGLSRDSRRRIVWWSPFALPLAACFVAVATVGLVWWKGYSGQRISEGDVFARADYAGAPMSRMAAAAVANGEVAEQAAAPVAAFAHNAGVAEQRTAEGLFAEHDATPAGLSLQGDLFASRVWAYGRSGAAVRDSALPAVGSEMLPAPREELFAADFSLPLPAEASAAGPRHLPSFAEGDVLLALQRQTAMTSAGGMSPAPDHRAAKSAAVAQLPAVPTDGGALAPASQSVSRSGAVPAAQSPAAQASAAQILASRSVSAQAGAADVSDAPAASVTTARPPASQPLSAQVLAEAVALVRPVDGATSPAAEQADTLSVPAATVPSAVSANLVAASSAVVAPSGAVRAAASVAVHAEPETDPGEAAAVDAASLTATEITTLAAAKRFSRASLAELEAAAFASDGNWKPGSEDITAAAARVADSSAPLADASQPVPPVRRSNLASRYVQAKLWVEAGQLPAPSDVDVDAIVRDAAQAYMPASLRRVRTQLAAAAVVSGQGVAEEAGRTVPSAAATAPAAAGAITAQELELLEAQSLLLRQVRAYALVLKDRPANAVAQLDAIAARLAERQHIAKSRNGQDFLKLLDATRALF